MQCTYVYISQCSICKTELTLVWGASYGMACDALHDRTALLDAQSHDVHKLVKKG